MFHIGLDVMFPSPCTQNTPHNVRYMMTNKRMLFNRVMNQWPADQVLWDGWLWPGTFV